MNYKQQRNKANCAVFYISWYSRTALARWRAAHVGDTRDSERRPYLATECDDLRKAEKWRRQIIGEISRKVAQIQNGLLYVDMTFDSNGNKTFFLISPATSEL